MFPTNSIIKIVLLNRLVSMSIGKYANLLWKSDLYVYLLSLFIILLLEILFIIIQKYPVFFSMYSLIFRLDVIYF